MDKRYRPQDHETKIYQQWQDTGVFNPDTPDQPSAQKVDPQPFTILLPPPNANDPLHVGHAMYTIEDVLIRYHRMKGDDTLWLPGTDHAGIETQYVYEKKLKKTGKSRFDFDRQDLYQQIWDYVEENSQTAQEQLKKIGFSLDWSRFKFMLDEDMVKIVLETFLELYQQKLVYRDVQLINYCPSCGTGFSDLEVIHQQHQAPLYYLRYGPVVVATTRPETIFGDTAVAVHPKDERYQQYVGQTISVKTPIGELQLPVIADDSVDPEFGTGAVKITPAHSFNDFATWQRHQNEMDGPKQVIDFSGKMMDTAGKYEGIYLTKARQQVVEDLESLDLIVKIDTQYQHQLGVCYRCQTPVEPLPLPQFFIKVKPLTKKVLKALDDQDVTIYGAGHDKILRHWLENLNDWNVSRQIVWGIRLPIWYEVSQPDIRIIFINKKGERIEGSLSDILERYKGKYSLNELKAGLQELRAPRDAKYQVSLDSPGDDFLQETDTFDTWFSSAQWPYTTLLTNQPDDFKRFYPTSVMETGYDILPFWVMRMLMMGLFKTDQVPFKNVYLHGLIRDEAGQKMSKSKGNVINPTEVVDQYGADALRMALVIRSAAGLDKSVGQNDFKAMRNLTNKVWNAARFIIINQSENQNNVCSKDEEFSRKMVEVIKEITKLLDELKIGLAAENLYNHFWHWFCDESIEAVKNGQLSQQILVEGLIVFLKLLHPFTPFVTEAIWQELIEKKIIDPTDKTNRSLLALSHWPA